MKMKLGGKTTIVLGVVIAGVGIGLFFVNKMVGYAVIGVGVLVEAVGIYGVIKGRGKGEVVAQETQSEGEGEGASS